MRVGKDDGHGVNFDWGADGRGNGGCLEEEIINAIGGNMNVHLRNMGHEVINMRPPNAASLEDSLFQRCNIANMNGVDIVVSLHANATIGGTGTEIYTYNADPLPEALYILSEMERIGFKNRGIKDGSQLAVINGTSARAMLIEICFCDNREDVIKYQNNIDTIARIIVSGITGVNIVQPPHEEKLIRVQVGAFKNRAAAEQLLQDLKNKGFDGFIKE